MSNVITSEPTPARFRAIVLDDDRSSALLVSKLLAHLRCEAIVCDTANEAIKAALDSTIDLVTLDISMPDLDGFQVLSLIRSHELTSRSPSVPVVAVTGLTSIVDQANIISRGFAAHVGKPVLLVRLEEVLGRSLLLRSELERMRYTRNRTHVEECVNQLMNRSGASRTHWLLGMAMAIEQQVVVALHQALLAALGREPTIASMSLQPVIALAQGIGATQLAARCRDFAAHAASDNRMIETAAALIRAELDRVVFTLRENVLT